MCVIAASAVAAAAGGAAAAQSSPIPNVATAGPTSTALGALAAGTPAKVSIRGTATVSSDRIAAVTLTCTGARRLRCRGRLTLAIDVRKKVRRSGTTVTVKTWKTIGSAGYDLWTRTTKVVDVKLTKAGLAALIAAKNHRLRVRATVTPKL